VSIRSDEKHDFEITDGEAVSRFAQKKENKTAHILEDGVDSLSMEDYRNDPVNSTWGGLDGSFIACGSIFEMSLEGLSAFVRR
jgi:hypothetical protein